MLMWVSPCTVHAPVPRLRKRARPLEPGGDGPGRDGRGQSGFAAAGRARGAADAAQAHSFFSHLDTNIQRILAGFGTLRDLVTDVRASLADEIGRAHV